MMGLRFMSVEDLVWTVALMSLLMLSLWMARDARR